MGLVIGALGMAVVALAVAVIVLVNSDPDSGSTPATGTVAKDAATQSHERACRVVESGGSTRLDLTESGLGCAEGQAIHRSFVKQLKAGITGPLEVGPWICTQEPFAVYPVLARCVTSSGRGLEVLGLAPSAHLSPTEIEAAEIKEDSAGGRADESQPLFFQTPSGNIICALSHQGTTCEILRKSYVPSVPKPPSCNLDYGHRLTVDAAGTVTFVCHGDSMSGTAERVLPYGRLLQRGQVTCRSEQSGMRCGTDTGGFKLSVQRVIIF
jgi:hypothetical protein